LIREDVPLTTLNFESSLSVCVGGSEALVHDLDEVWHLAAGRADRLTPAIFASRTLQSTPESGARADYDSAKCRQGSKVHAAKPQGIRLDVVKLPKAKRGLVLLPRRWVVERPLAWTTRFRRLASNYKRLPETLAGLPSLARLCLRSPKAIPLSL
jgi:transposase